MASTLIKNKIKHSYNRASNSYENSSYVQKHCAQFLIQKLQEFGITFYPQTVLDLGSGTGHLPEILINHYPKARYIINDIAPKMLKQAKFKFINYDNFEFHIGDMESLIFEDYDLIVTNLALQWVDNLMGMLNKCIQHSKVFAFSCLLDGTFAEWDCLLRSYKLTSNLKSYPTEKELILFSKKLADKKFYFATKDLPIKFSNVYAFMLYLKSLGAGISNSTTPISILKSLITNHRDTFVVTYKVFFGIFKD